MLAQANLELRRTSIIRAIQLAIVVVAFGIWVLATSTHAISALFLPGPLAVVTSLIHLTGTKAFWGAVGVTTFTTAVAYGCAVVGGIFFGFLIGRSPVLTQAYRPVLAGIFSIPLTLFFPLFVVSLGLGPPSKIAFGALYGFFPIVLNTIAAFSGIDPLFLRSARSQGATPSQTLTRIYIPGAFPIVLSGLRIGFFITFASVLGGETLASASGVGHAIAHEAELLDSAPMFAWIVTVLSVTVLLNLFLSLVEKRAGRSS